MKIKNEKGFTLVELIIVIAIMLVFAVVAIPGFNKANNRNKFDSKAEEIVSLISHAYAVGFAPYRVEIGTGSTAGTNCDVGKIDFSTSVLNLIYYRTVGSSVVPCTGSTSDVVGSVALDGGFAASLSFIQPTSALMQFSSSKALFKSAKVKLTDTKDADHFYLITIVSDPFKITKEYLDSE